MGDFSMSNAKIYDPTTAVANPAFDPTKPTGPSNFPYTRSQFPDNMIPSDSINSSAQAFLMQYVPHANMMMDGAGGFQQLPRYSATRTHYQDQGPFAWTMSSQNDDTIFGQLLRRRRTRILA